jgi:hypothetical protein
MNDAIGKNGNYSITALFLSEESRRINRRPGLDELAT